MTKFTLRSTVFAVSLFFPSLAFAQDGDGDGDATPNDVILINNAAKDEKAFVFSYGEPTSPVLPLVNVAADQITRVESLRRFGLTVINGSESSKTDPAVAIDFSPFWLANNEAVSLASYREMSSFKRILSRLKISAAVSEGDTSSSRPSSMVFSAATKLLDKQDPQVAYDFENCVSNGDTSKLIGQILAAGNAALPADPRQAGAAALAARSAKAAALKGSIEKAYNKCVTETAKIIAKEPSLDIGAGFRLTGDPGKFSNLRSSGAIVWATYATGVFGGLGGSESNGFASQIRGVIHARHTFKEAVYDNNSTLLGRRDATMIAAGLETVPLAGKQEKFRWSLQGGWNRQKTSVLGTPNRNYWRAIGRSQFQIQDGLWLNLSAGRVQGKGIESDTYLLFGISFNPSARKTGIASYYEKARY